MIREQQQTNRDNGVAQMSIEEKTDDGGDSDADVESNSTRPKVKSSTLRALNPYNYPGDVEDEDT